MATGNDSASIEPGFSRQTNLTVEGVSINLAIECRCVRTSLIADRLLEARLGRLSRLNPTFSHPNPRHKTPSLAREIIFPESSDPTGLKNRFSSL